MRAARTLHDDATASSPPAIRLTVILLAALFAVIVLRTAWVSDDAYITFRVVDNWIHGFGPTWNVGERVQAYTHPLWLMLVTALVAITREPYFTSIALSLLLSTGAVLLLGLRIAVTPASGTLAVLVLLLSKAFVDFSTSGLENPLVSLLLAICLTLWIGTAHSPGRLRTLGLTAGLLGVTRMDVLLLVLPLFLVEAWRLRRARPIQALVPGVLVFAAWEMFSLFYYGFAFPNSAYAKLGTGISRSELLVQGVHYLLESLRRDPLTLTVIALGLVTSLLPSRRDRAPIAAGIALYLGYIVWIGGDFMSGRFLTAPLFAAAALLAREPLKLRTFATAGIALALLGLGFAVPTAPPLSGPAYAQRATGLIDAHGIADERGYYFQQTGLFRANGGRGVDGHPEAVRGHAVRANGRAVVAGGNIGFFGFYAGPQVHIIDAFALADPLLARLPIRSVKWRVGHYVRNIPAGYPETLGGDRNVIVNERIRGFYDRLSLITRGPLLGPGRLGAIWEMNTGGSSQLIAPLYAARRLQNEGQKALDSGRYDPAIRALEQSVELDGSRGASWYLLFDALQKVKRLDDAHHALNRAIEEQPNLYEQGLMDLGAHYARDGQAGKAAQTLEQYVALRPDSPRGHALLGSAYEQLDDVTKAVEQYGKALALNPNAPELRKRLESLRR